MDDQLRGLHDELAVIRGSVERSTDTKELVKTMNPAGLARFSKVIELFETYFNADIIMLQEAAITAIREELLFFCDDIAGVNELRINNADLRKLRASLLAPFAFLGRDKPDMCDKWMNGIYYRLLDLVDNKLEDCRQLNPGNAGNGSDDSGDELSCTAEVW